MFRLSKVTDYGIRILAHLARDVVAGDPHAHRDAPSQQTTPAHATGLHATGQEARHNAREVSEELGLPLPMVSKVMKSLARAGVLESHRGAKGGFSLTRRPEHLTVAHMIAVLEGPVALTECQLADSLCSHEGSCSVQQPWSVINQAVQNTLATITLADLIHPAFPRSSSILSLGVEPASSSSSLLQVAD